jgi:hypothetical protein
VRFGRKGGHHQTAVQKAVGAEMRAGEDASRVSPSGAQNKCNTCNTCQVCDTCDANDTCNACLMWCVAKRVASSCCKSRRKRVAPRPRPIILHVCVGELYCFSQMKRLSKHAYVGSCTQPKPCPYMATYRAALAASLQLSERLQLQHLHCPSRQQESLAKALRKAWVPPSVKATPKLHGPLWTVPPQPSATHLEPAGDALC